MPFHRIRPRAPHARRRGALALALIAAAVAPAALAAPASADCPGASAGSCPYTAVTQVGQVGGVLRFPQAVAVGGDGAVYVGDQSSHVVHVFNADGSLRGTIGVPGTQPGQISSVGSVAVGADGLFVAEGATNRVLRFDTAGTALGSFGGSGDAPGRFRFGAGGGNDAAAGGGLALAGGFVYVVDTGNDRVQRLLPNGTDAVELVAPGPLANPRGIAVWGGRVFVADDQHHRIGVFDVGGHPVTSIGSGQGNGPGQLNYPYGVAVDPKGRVFVADDLNHRVVRFGGVPAYAYRARWGSYGRLPGQLAYPRSLATDAQGNVYVADTGNDRVDVFDNTGALLRSFGADGRAPGQFDAPTGVAADASGVRAVTDAVNGRVQLLNPDGSIAAVWGSPNPGPTVLPHPVAVAFDGSGNAYVLDDRRSRIVVFDRATGTPMRTIGSQGSGPAQLLAPSALAIDAAGTISVADAGNARIARFALDGSYLGSTSGVEDPRGIAVTPDGTRTYVTDGANRITAYDPGGAVLATFGGTGSKLGKLNVPGQLTVDAAGNLWVADRGNNRVQEFGPAGERLLTFGTRGAGPGQFIHPAGVSIDCHGLLTVTDTDGNRVQQLALTAPPAAACGALPAPAQPAAPQTPTLPAPPGPSVTLRTLRTTGLLATRVLPLRVGCDTTCTLSASGTLTQRSTPPRGRRAASVPLGAQRLTIRAGQTAIVRLRLSRTSAASLRRALKGRRGLTALLQVTATATVGAPSVLTSRVQVTG